MNDLEEDMLSPLPFSMAKLSNMAAPIRMITQYAVDPVTGQIVPRCLTPGFLADNLCGDHRAQLGETSGSGGAPQICIICELTPPRSPLGMASAGICGHANRLLKERLFAVEDNSLYSVEGAWLLAFQQHEGPEHLLLVASGAEERERLANDVGLLVEPGITELMSRLWADAWPGVDLEGVLQQRCEAFLSGESWRVPPKVVHRLVPPPGYAEAWREMVTEANASTQEKHARTEVARTKYVLDLRTTPVAAAMAEHYELDPSTGALLRKEIFDLDLAYDVETHKQHLLEGEADADCPACALDAEDVGGVAGIIQRSIRTLLARLPSPEIQVFAWADDTPLLLLEQADMWGTAFSNVLVGLESEEDRRAWAEANSIGLREGGTRYISENLSGLCEDAKGSRDAIAAFLAGGPWRAPVFPGLGPLFSGDAPSDEAGAKGHHTEGAELEEAQRAADDLGSKLEQQLLDPTLPVEDVIATARGLAGALQESNRPGDSVAVQRANLLRLRDRYGPVHGEYLYSRAMLARSLLLVDDDAGARWIADEVAATLDGLQRPPGGHDDRDTREGLVSVRACVAQCYWEMQDYPEAAQQWLDCRAITESEQFAAVGASNDWLFNLFVKSILALLECGGEEIASMECRRTRRAWIEAKGDDDELVARLVAEFGPLLEGSPPSE